MLIIIIPRRFLSNIWLFHSSLKYCVNCLSGPLHDSRISWRDEFHANSQTSDITISTRALQVLLGTQRSLMHESTNQRPLITCPLPNTKLFKPGIVSYSHVVHTSRTLRTHGLPLRRRWLTSAARVSRCLSPTLSSELSRGGIASLGSTENHNV